MNKLKQQILAATITMLILTLVAICACGCMTTSSHYETTITDPNGVTRTVYVHHGTTSVLYDLSKVKVDLQLKDIGSLEVLGSVAEAQKIEDMAKIVEIWAKGGI